MRAGIAPGAANRLLASSATSTQSDPKPCDGGVKVRVPVFANRPIGIASPLRGLNHHAATRVAGDLSHHDVEGASLRAVHEQVAVAARGLQVVDAGERVGDDRLVGNAREIRARLHQPSQERKLRRTRPVDRRGPVHQRSVDRLAVRRVELPHGVIAVRDPRRAGEDVPVRRVAARVRRTSSRSARRGNRADDPRRAAHRRRPASPESAHSPRRSSPSCASASASPWPVCCMLKSSHGSSWNAVDDVHAPHGWKVIVTRA